ncbi:quercetin 2,3-dioxygenase [Bacillus sp. AFS029533]|uniref:quercetin 2,3-dioxygenase n=1 Tax=Bacillus sp. AFS029533 TaxID=2033494 RepID=UPI000BFB5235|nr:quercetin 2,3-dioxygenase [Bacillus sp. AFS029533]PGZ90663.1 cupin [Bacillus sp. AFS029533]
MTFKQKRIAGFMHRGITEENTYFFLNDFTSILVSGEDTNGAFCVLHCNGKKDGGPPLHVHELEDETFYVLEGEITFFIGDQTILAKAGDYVFAPRGIPHTFKVCSEETQFIVTAYPSGFDQFVKELSEPFYKGFKKPEDPPSAKKIQKLIEVSKKYKISYPTI